MGAFGTYFVASGWAEDWSFKIRSQAECFLMLEVATAKTHCFGETQQPGFFMVFSRFAANKLSRFGRGFAWGC